MTPKAVAIIACRLLAIWFFVQAARNYADTISRMFEMRNAGIQPIVGYPPLVQHILYSSVGPLADLGASVVLWLGASVLAGYMTRGMQNNVATAKETKISNWQTLGFSLIGMLLCAQGLSFSCGYIASLLFAGNIPYYGPFYSAETWPKIIVSAAQFLVGLILLFRAQKTIRVLDYLQRGGRDGSSND
jgi:hypothetical protein